MPENYTDPMASATSSRIYPNKLIPTGQTESQPDVSGLGFVTDRDKQIRTRRSSLGTRAAGVVRRFEAMKLEISEWKTSDESQFISINAINDRAPILTKLSQDFLTLTNRVLNNIVYPS